MFCHIIRTTYQKIGDLFCPVHISGLSHSVKARKLNQHVSSVMEFLKMQDFGPKINTLKKNNCSYFVNTINLTDRQKLGMSPKDDLLFKGQLISKCPFGVNVSTKIPTKKFDKFCPRI